MPAPFRRLFLAFVLALSALAPWDAAPALAAEKPKAAKLSAEDQADLARIEEYLNAIRTMRSRFIQVAPSGAHAEGEIQLWRPGRLRIAYDPPVPILIVVNTATVGYYDRELKQAQYLGTDQTPAGVLVRERIRLAGGDLTVTHFEKGQGTIRLAIVRNDDPGAGAITLVFSGRPLTLRKWYVIDAQAQTTEISLLGPQFGVALEPKAFLFDEMVVPPQISN